MAGYSATPLARKLSLRDGHRVAFEAVPDSVRAEIESQGLALTDATGTEPLDAILVFTASAQALADRLPDAMRQIAPAGFLWVAWPKRASKRPTDLTEDRIRALALPLGLVDVKVCAIDATWSGLKLTIRKQLR